MKYLAFLFVICFMIGSFAVAAWYTCKAAEWLARRCKNDEE